MDDGSWIVGIVGLDMDKETAKLAARQVGLAMLSTIKKNIGSFNKIKRVNRHAHEPEGQSPVSRRSPGADFCTGDQSDHVFRTAGTSAQGSRRDPRAPSH